MRKWARRSDKGQPQLVAELRDVPGVTVHVISRCPGCLDILVGFRGRTTWWELKDGPNAPLTETERQIMESWTGHVAVAYSAEDILRDIGAAE